LAAAAAIGERYARPVAALPWPTGPTSRPMPDNDVNAVTVGRVVREFEAKALLARYGLVVPVAVECALADAPQVAARIGFPVVIKISNETIAHKSDVGGVALGLRSPDEVAVAVTGMAALGDRVLVEQMVGGAVAELIVGVVRDPQFGFALLIGAGGVLAELITDSVTLLLPATREDIERALRTLRVWTLIAGHRGRKGDPDSVLSSGLSGGSGRSRRSIRWQSFRERIFELRVIDTHAARAAEFAIEQMIIAIDQHDNF
jgi:acetyl-CoA synthetase